MTLIDCCAFYGCKSLIEIQIPSSVTIIGYGSFYGCRSLIKVSIPSSVKKIGSCAFHGCSIYSIKFASTDIFIGEDVFPKGMIFLKG